MIALIDALNNRELALLIWSLIGLFFAVRIAGHQIREVLRSFFVRAIFGSLLLLGAYVSATVFALYKLGFWDSGLLKDTILWFVVTASVTLFDSVKKGTENPNFFRDLVIDNIKAAAVLEFVIDTFVMPLGWELLFVPVAFVLGAFKAIADSRPEYSVTRKPIGFLLGCMTLTILGYAAHELVVGLREFTTIATAKEFLLAPILTACCLPFFFTFALWISYQELFVRIEVWMKERPDLAQVAKMHSLRICNVGFGRLDRLRGRFYMELQEATSALAVRATVEKHACPLPSHPAEVLTGEVVATRIIPYKLPSNGASGQMVLIDWKNTSTRAIAAAWAEITPLDENRERLEGGSPEHCVFSYEDNNMKKIEPGETYIEPDGLGFILLSMLYGKATYVEVQMVRFEAD